MRKTASLSLVFFILVLSANLFAEARQKGEFSLGGGVFFAGHDGSAFGAASFGYYSKFIGAEVNGALIMGGGIIGGNLVLGLFNAEPLIPYVTGGAWITTYGGFGFDVGGGIKIRLSKVFAIRVEYRRYLLDEGDWGVNTLIGGISLFF